MGVIWSSQRPGSNGPSDEHAAMKYAVTVLWGSQSGTAEALASSLCKRLDERGTTCDYVDCEDFDDDRCEIDDDCWPRSAAFVVLLMATYGDGDAVELHHWVNSAKRRGDELRGVRYCVFGLGSTQYEQYNAVGKRFDRRLEELGGERVGCYGEGDDDDDIERDCYRWAASNIPEIEWVCGLPARQRVAWTVVAAQHGINWHVVESVSTALKQVWATEQPVLPCPEPTRL